MTAKLGEDSTQVVMGADATEEWATENASDFRFLHLSTHGFFASGECRESLGMWGHYSGQIYPVVDFDFDPLAQSGLVLAMANDRDTREPGTDDGIWTALEVASQDLSGTELVVLSACETGLGEVEAGEGVLGLQRAFQSAGARTLIMSLWAVDDQATRSLMEGFYGYRFGDTPMSESEALRKAQLDLLEANRAQGRARPGTWGAFFAAGDWN